LNVVVASAPADDHSDCEGDSVTGHRPVDVAAAFGRGGGWHSVSKVRELPVTRLLRGYSLVGDCDLSDKNYRGSEISVHSYTNRMHTLQCIFRTRKLIVTVVCSAANQEAFLYRSRAHAQTHQSAPRSGNRCKSVTSCVRECMNAKPFLLSSLPKLGEIMGSPSWCRVWHAGRGAAWPAERWTRLSTGRPQDVSAIYNVCCRKCVCFGGCASAVRSLTWVGEAASSSSRHIGCAAQQLRSSTIWLGGHLLSLRCALFSDLRQTCRLPESSRPHSKAFRVPRDRQALQHIKPEHRFGRWDGFCTSVRLRNGWVLFSSP
jgi:hypothetical protein